MDQQYGLEHVLNFVIPKGKDGKDGAQGETGPTGPKGEQGEVGPAGSSVTIKGSYDTLEELLLKHPVGKESDAYLIGDNLYVWSVDGNSWKDVGVIRGPKGEKGEMGPQGIPGPTGLMGPTGPTGPAIKPEIGGGFFVALNSSLPSGGYQVASNMRLPITRKDTDNMGIYSLDSQNYTIQFNQQGSYKITFIVNAYIPSITTFNPEEDFIAIGLKKVNENIIYAGASNFVYDSNIIQLVGQGILIIGDIAEVVELVNMSKKTIYLDTPKIENTTASSYFINPIVSLVIEYLG